MKDFFERYQARLEVEDLRRYARILVEDLSGILSGHELVVRLLDEPEREAELDGGMKEALLRNRVLSESETGRLHLPVKYDKKALALITATPSPGRAIHPETAGLLPAFIRLSLEKILMYKINVTDKETGLYNDDYFRTFLRRRLEPRSKPGPGQRPLIPLRLSQEDTHPDLTVLLVEIRDYDRLATQHGRVEAVRALLALAGRLKPPAEGSCCLARLDRGRLALALLKSDLASLEELARQVAIEADVKDLTGPLRLNLAFGLANFPLDFGDEPVSAEADDLRNDGLAEQLLAKAELALNHALVRQGEPVLTYRQVLQFGGRVVQVLPYNRVVINLGRAAGAREGQVFVLNEASPAAEAEVDYKGEVVLFEVREDYALGQVINLRCSISRVTPGDVLVLSRTSLEEPPAGDRAWQGLDQLLGLPDHHRFMVLLAERMEIEEKFALILVRVDGYERYRTTMGHLESDRQLKALSDLLQEDRPADCLTGRFSSDSLALFLPGLGEEEARRLAEGWRDKIKTRLRQTSSFGVIVFPQGTCPRGDLVANAQKALEHAGFFGPASVAVFDAVSLNISGDKRFEAGDWEGAIEEYRKGLELNPRDLNLLNSLGVCYGQRKMLQEALTAFDQVLSLDPDNLMAHFNRGYILAMNGRAEEALESFRRAAALDPENFDVLFHRGRTALDLNLVDEALDSFQRSAGVEDRKPIVFRWLGQALLQAGRREEAVDAFKAAARHDPEDASSLSQLGVLFLERGTDLDVALSLIRQSVTLDPSNGLFRERLGRALTKAGDLKEAEAQYRRAIEMGARGREIFYELGKVVRDLGRPEEARRHFEESLAVDAEFKPAAEALAELKD
ncbi:MAG: tetratricopeptide repeat protein [Thermodesulfobacteriota bacterium]